jgi:TolA-binding protein
MIRCLCIGLILLLVGCGGGGGPQRPPATAPAPLSASSATIDSLWAQTETNVRHGKWGDAAKLLDRLLLEFAPGDPRIARAHYYLGEAYYAQGRHLEAAREFRKASDETPNDPIAPEALVRVGDVYSDLWRRPELDPT